MRISRSYPTIPTPVQKIAKLSIPRGATPLPFIILLCGDDRWLSSSMPMKIGERIPVNNEAPIISQVALASANVKRFVEFRGDSEGETMRIWTVDGPPLYMGYGYQLPSSLVVSLMEGGVVAPCAHVVIVVEEEVVVVIIVDTKLNTTIKNL